jgi:predicted nucleic acid-binding protein
VKLAADANVLLAAVIGGRARLALNHPSVEEIFTTAHTFSEVEEYSAYLARKKRLPIDAVLLAVAALPVTVLHRSRYAGGLPEASQLIRHRDSDDIELLALVLHMQVPLWSNDKDFQHLGIELFTTERLLRQLGIIH